MHHELTWTQPPALINRSALLLAARQAFQAPAILRFDTDAFMPEFLTLLETSPERMAEYKVRRETWRGFVPATTPDAARAPSLLRRRLGLVRRRANEPGPALTATAVADSTPVGTPLKLYQPAHQRHYLVASSLVCKVPGLPDRAVDAGRGEQTAFVIRRLLPPAADAAARVESWEEYAWIPGPHGNLWRHVGTDPERVVEGEERHAFFALQFAEHERRRRLFAGVIPVGRREAYLGAPKSDGGATTPGITARTARKVLLRKEVIEPWKSLLRRAQQVNQSFVPPAELPSTEEKAARLRLERSQLQTISWLVLLDFAKYLATYVRPVWRAVLNPAAGASLNAPERTLFDAIEAASLSATLRDRLRWSDEVTLTGTEIYPAGAVPSTLREALARFGTAPDGIDVALEQRIESIDRGYDRHSATSRALWPAFVFPLADPDRPLDAPLPPIAPLGSLSAEEVGELTLDDDPTTIDPLERIDRLAVLVLRALRDDGPEPVPQPAIPTAAVAPANALEGWFVIRCVYDRPGCEPLHAAVVSDATEPFQMAGFFDPDAPARPIRIGLPIDTTPAGLRKFDKNTAFVISDTLCGQIQRMKALTLGDLVLSVLPWPFHKDLPDLQGGSGPCRTSGGDSLGMICSLSIPIVTICALILLMIMVSLFDFVFRWLPYFIFCFPLPGLKAKKS